MSKNTSPTANIFHPDTRFVRQARRPGGVDRDQALQRAQAEVDELKSDFNVWIDKEFEQLNAALSQLASDPTDKAALELAHNICSQLRDVGGTMGYQLVTFVARTLSDILEAYIGGAAYDKKVVDCHIDAFMLARMEQYRHLSPEQVPEMTHGLLRVVELASIIPPDPGK
jgi:hypothetical protein